MQNFFLTRSPYRLSLVGLSTKMRIEQFQLNEVKFAWCNRLFLHFGTHRRKKCSDLSCLDQRCLTDLLAPYGIHVLEVGADEVEIRLLLSLLHSETVSAAASKTKGRISKWLNERSVTATNDKFFARGYFAVTTGQPTADDVEAYLDHQPKHHGYADRVRPPVFLRQYEHTETALRSVETDHAVTWLRYHLVLVTQFRHGVFDSISGEAITESWRCLQSRHRFLIDKISFVPDHVHVAVSVHPAASPANLVLELMNLAQQTMWLDFESSVIKARVNRLWEQSAYIGSFGQLSSNAVSTYLRRWSQQPENSA